MGDHTRHRCFSVRSRNTNGIARFGNLAQDLCTFHHSEIVLPEILQFAVRCRNGRRINDKGSFFGEKFSGDQLNTILVMDLCSFGRQRF
ncbi:hypothetical protein SDC9_180120 [bioreactor metagenome]|uniref:Uncharacterized protein n=1 Tax=bioreactor metagenome TaxID=1076179 RepID=A0A645H1U9_9ZZZZ